jgi:16S rRNA processing protein RimM
VVEQSAHRPPGSTVEVTVGRIARAHGLRGDVVVDLRTDDPARRFSPGTTFVTPRGNLVVESTHWHGSRLLVRFAQTPDRGAAEALRGLDLRLDVSQDERPDDPEEFYDHQLRGLTAYTTAGRLVGTVTDVLHLPAQDTLVIDADGREVLVPFVVEIVPTVDLAAGTVAITEQPGLLEDS